MDSQNNIPLREDRKKVSILQEAEGIHENHCSGFFESRNNSYIVGLNLSTAKVKQDLGHGGSNTLNEINAFDKAEVADINLGQINVITVSSFCGPKGLLLGVDLLPPKNFDFFKINSLSNKKCNVYDMKPLINATRELLGTLKDKRFPIFPGSHIPCAGKSIQKNGPCELYSAIAIGIPENREVDACLLMEDVGVIQEQKINDIKRYLVNSIESIGQNQSINYKSIFIGIETIDTKPGETGCALVFAPYLSFPKKIVRQAESFVSETLEEWQEKNA